MVLAANPSVARMMCAPPPAPRPQATLTQSFLPSFFAAHLPVSPRHLVPNLVPTSPKANFASSSSTAQAGGLAYAAAASYTPTSLMLRCVIAALFPALTSASSATAS
jgi:hypothetical protein